MPKQQNINYNRSKTFTFSLHLHVYSILIHRQIKHDTVSKASLQLRDKT